MKNFRLGFILLFKGILLIPPIIGFATDEINLNNSDLTKASNFYDLGYKYYKLQDWDNAIENFKKVLEIQSNNPDAQLFLGYSYLFRNKSRDELLESKKMFELVISEVPTYQDAIDGLERVNKALAEQEEQINKEKILKAVTAEKEQIKCLQDEAKILSKENNHLEAIDIYLYLIDNFSPNAQFYYDLGHEYASIGDTCKAITAYNNALYLKPDYTDALVGLGGQYLALNNPFQSRQYYVEAYEIDPNNVDALLGLAQVEYLLDNFRAADYFYELAIYLRPNDPYVLEPYALFLVNSNRFRESKNVYNRLNYKHDYKRILFNLTSHTDPYILTSILVAQELERNKSIDKLIAKLNSKDFDIMAFYPASDRLRWGFGYQNREVNQLNLIPNQYLFNFESNSLIAKGELFYNPSWTFTGDLKVENVNNNFDQVILKTKNKTIFKPSFYSRYSNNHDLINFGTLTDTIIFKDFNKNRVLLVERSNLFLSYQRDFGNNSNFGSDVAWYWYFDSYHNQEKQFNLWVQKGIPFFKNDLNVRYQGEYVTFKKDVTAYYSFEYRLTNWLRLNYAKDWCDLRLNIEYWHGWRVTRGRNVQEQLIVNPIQGKVRTLSSEVDVLSTILGYTIAANFDIFLHGYYYHDTFEYTAWYGKLACEWRY